MTYESLVYGLRDALSSPLARAARRRCTKADAASLAIAASSGRSSPRRTLPLAAASPGRSREAIARARAITVDSSSAAGTTSFTSPHSSA